MKLITWGQIVNHSMKVWSAKGQWLNEMISNEVDYMKADCKSQYDSVVSKKDNY